MNSHKDHSIEAQRRATWRKIAPAHELGADTDGAAVRNARAIGGVRIDPKRLNTSSESTRSSERGALTKASLGRVMFELVKSEPEGKTG